MFTFGNQMGVDMLETTLVALQDLTLDKIFDEPGRKALHAEVPKLMEQVHQLLSLSKGLAVPCLGFERLIF